MVFTSLHHHFWHFSGLGAIFASSTDFVFRAAVAAAAGVGGVWTRCAGDGALSRHKCLYWRIVGLLHSPHRPPQHPQPQKVWRVAVYVCSVWTWVWNMIYALQATIKTMQEKKKENIIIFFLLFLLALCPPSHHCEGRIKNICTNSGSAIFLVFLLPLVKNTHSLSHTHTSHPKHRKCKCSTFGERYLMAYVWLWVYAGVCAWLVILLFV